MPRSPIADGFRAVLRGPGLFLAELAWRWCFGIAAWVLIILAFREWLASIRFSDADWLLVRTRQPLLAAEAVVHALQGTGARLIQAGIIVALALVVFWILAASAGRLAILKALLSRQQKTGFGSLVGLHFLRAALTLAAVLGFLGIAILTGYVFPVDPANAAGLMARVFLFLALAVAVGFLWSLVNWFLALAPVFVMRDGRDTFGAISASVGFFRRRSGPLLGVTLLFDLVRLLLLILAILAAALPLAHAGRASELITGLWFALGVTLVYFALADFLYIARLAAYVSILEQDVEPEPQIVLAASEP